MDGVKPEDYGKIAEELVFQYLTEQGKNPQRVQQKPGNIGDIKIGKIIEVKGQSEDFDASDNEDRVRNLLQFQKLNINL